MRQQVLPARARGARPECPGPDGSPWGPYPAVFTAISNGATWRRRKGRTPIPTLKQGSDPYLRVVSIVAAPREVLGGSRAGQLVDRQAVAARGLDLAHRAMRDPELGAGASARGLQLGHGGRHRG